MKETLESESMETYYFKCYSHHRLPWKGIYELTTEWDYNAGKIFSGLE